MLARVISYNLASCQALEDNLNEWLAEVGDIHIDRCVTLGTAGSDRDHGAIAIFYREQGEPIPDVSGEATCRQCKKRPADPGKKSCGECREYQRVYREQRKDEKKKSRYP